MDFALLRANMQHFEAVSSVAIYLAVSRAVRLQQKPQKRHVLRISAAESVCLLTGYYRLHHEQTAPCIQKS